MFKALFITFLLLLCNKTYGEDYKPFTRSGRIELLGVVTSYNHTVYPQNGTWIFMSIIIPELVKGNINAHSDDVDEIFNLIAITRQDIAAHFNEYFYETYQSFRISLMCISGSYFNDNPQIRRLNTTTGEMSLYIQCYKNNTKLVGLPVLTNSTASLKSKTPVNCHINKSNCTEGYCVMFERKVFLGETNLVSVIQDFYCPNDFYNFLNFESTNNIFVASYTTTVLSAAQICMQLSSNGNKFEQKFQL
uniref:Spike protein n=1 Tax=Strongyloides papillosus TaxID=174720 RepID=A0A0N5CH75_STREA